MFGCAACIPDEPHHAVQLGLLEVARLVDESHFTIKIRACRECGQRFVWVFTEIIDRIKGEDRQSWTVLPITGDEAEAMIAQGERVNLDEIQAMGRTRRFLRDDHHGFEYRFGIVIGVHS